MMAMALWASALSAQSHWQCDYAKFSESMAVFFQITDGDQVIADVTPYEVAAFVGEECRGVAQFVEEEVNDNTVKYGYLRIYSNGESNEKIALKVYNSTSQLEKRLAVSSFLFEKDLRIGVPSSPVKYDIAANVPKYQLTLTPQDALMGTAEGSGIFEENDFAHISATANTGYHFVKWSDENTDAERTIEITAKTDLVAIFAPNQHLLTFISEGDTVRAAQQDYNSTIVPPEAPLKEGYSFTGWKPAIAEKMPNNPLTYEAQFQINEYTMTFVVDGQKVREAVLEYGKPVPTPSVPAKTGFTFAGWEPAVPATVPGRDVTFTAQWERNKYVAFFIADGDTIKSDSILYEAAIEKPADPTKTGYTFTGWTPEVLATMPASDTTFTAQFAINQYTMTFVFDNGEENAVVKQDYATPLTAPADPQKTGFTFAGWSTAVPATVPAKDSTFTAQWIRNKYVAFFIADGDTIKSDSILYEAAIEKPADPTKTGYTFTGWTPEVLATMPASDTTFTAQFAINQYTMTFVFDNGEENVVVKQDYATPLTAPADPQKTGFTFTGWSTAVPETIPAKDSTFTAQWIRNKYVAFFIADGDTIKSDSILYEAAIEKPADPTKTGYTFTGWTPEVLATMPASDTTFTAQFAINQYTMTFVFDNGEENAVVKQDYATPLTAPADPQKTGFTFAGWSPEVPATIPAADQTFTAQWERNKYIVMWIVENDTTIVEVAFEDAVVNPNDPVKEGYTFIGWDAEIPEKMPAADLTFKAQFKVNIYAIIYIVNGEEWARDSVAYGETIKLREYTPDEGYDFNGWESDAEYTTMPAHDVTFRANITLGIIELLTAKQSVTVYRMDGTLVARNIPVADLKKLPRGLYIIRGKKVAIK